MSSALTAAYCGALWLPLDIRKKRWVKRTAKDEWIEEHDKETKKNMQRPREERKKFGYLY